MNGNAVLPGLAPYRRLRARYSQSLLSRRRGRPASPRKSQTKSQRRPASGDTQRRQATVQPGQVPTERHRATSSDARNVTGGQGVAGSNPAVPTGNRVFSNMITYQKSQQRANLLRNGPARDVRRRGCHGVLTAHAPTRQGRLSTILAEVSPRVEIAQSADLGTVMIYLDERAGDEVRGRARGTRRAGNAQAASWRLRSMRVPGLTVGKQRASVLEQHDAVAEQAPSLPG